MAIALRQLSAGVAGIALAAGGANAGFAVIIDDFSDAGGESLDGAFNETLVFDTGSMIGGWRGLRLSTQENPFDLFLDVQIVPPIGAASASGTDVQGRTGFIYGLQDDPSQGGDGTLPNSLNLDTTATPILEVDLRSLDLETDLTVTIRTEGGGESVGSILLMPIDAPETVQLDLTTFMGGADLTDVDVIEIAFNDEFRDDIDFSVSEFRLVVPTPGAAGLALLGLAATTRRRR
jgi:hypothetical protein